jgi:hypothetical protein
LDSSRRVLSKYQNGFSRFDPQLPELLAEVRGNSNFGEQLLSIRASLAKFKSTAAFVSSRASSWCFQFVHLTSELTSIDDFVLGSNEAFFSGEQTPLFFVFLLRFLSCYRSPTPL